MDEPYIDLAKDTEWHCWWWDPAKAGEAEEGRERGILNYSPKRGLVLTTHIDLATMFEEVAGVSSGSDVLHAMLLGSIKATLFQPQLSRWRASGNSDLRCEALLLGHHLPTPDNKCVTTLHLDLPTMAPWASPGPFRPERLESGVPIRLQYTLDNTPIVLGELDGGDWSGVIIKPQSSPGRLRPQVDTKTEVRIGDLAQTAMLDRGCRKAPRLGGNTIRATDRDSYAPCGHTPFAQGG